MSTSSWRAFYRYCNKDTLYTEFNMKELRNLAKKIGIPGYIQLKKPALCRAIRRQLREMDKERVTKKLEREIEEKQEIAQAKKRAQEQRMKYLTQKDRPGKYMRERQKVFKQLGYLHDKPPSKSKIEKEKMKQLNEVFNQLSEYEFWTKDRGKTELKQPERYNEIINNLKELGLYKKYQKFALERRIKGLRNMKQNARTIASRDRIQKKIAELQFQLRRIN